MVKLLPSRSRTTPSAPTTCALPGKNDTALRRWIYGGALFKDDNATLDDLREAVTTLEDTERTARRVLGRSHPTTAGVERALREARAALRARETQSSGDA